MKVCVRPSMGHILWYCSCQDYASLRLLPKQPLFVLRARLGWSQAPEVGGPWWKLGVTWVRSVSGENKKEKTNPREIQESSVQKKRLQEANEAREEAKSPTPFWRAWPRSQTRKCSSCTGLGWVLRVLVVSFGFAGVCGSGVLSWPGCLDALNDCPRGCTCLDAGPQESDYTAVRNGSSSPDSLGSPLKHFFPGDSGLALGCTAGLPVSVASVPSDLIRFPCWLTRMFLSLGPLPWPRFPGSGATCGV